MRRPYPPRSAGARLGGRNARDCETAMGSKIRGRAEELGSKPKETRAQVQWPVWARIAISLGIFYHFAAVVGGALGVPPSSSLEQSFAELFRPYHELVDVGYSYRYYAEPPPTPVVTAALQFGDGRPEETVRLPGLKVPGPRMRHQRQLALANALAMAVRQAKEHTGDASMTPLARAYARHICATRPDCRSVILRLQYHLIPELAQVHEAIQSPFAPRFDLFNDSLFTTPEWIGDYPCDGF
jgi:hypothetical protein